MLCYNTTTNSIIILHVHTNLLQIRLRYYSKTIIYVLIIIITCSNVAPFTTQIWKLSVAKTYEGVILSYSCTFIVHCLHLRTGSFLFVAGQENWLSRRNIPGVTKPYRHMTYCQLRVHIHLHMSILSLHPLSQNMSEHNRDYRTCL